MLKIIYVKYPFFLLIMVVLTATLSCTSGDEDKKPAPKPMQTAAFSSPMPVPMPQQQTIAPEAKNIPPVEAPGQLVISPSAETGAQLYTSWPLIVSAHLWRKAILPDGQGTLPAAEPITLQAKQGSWRDALVVDVTNAYGEHVAWPLHPVQQSEGSVTLGVDDTATAEWWLEPTETQTLPAGAYTLTVSFRSNTLEGLPGYIVSDRFHLKIEKEPAPLPQTTASAKQLEIAAFSLFRGDTKNAGALVDQILAREPENIGGLRLQAKLLVREGKKLEAANKLEEALHVYYKKYPKADPPLGLLHERSEAIKDMKPEIIKESSPTK